MEGILDVRSVFERLGGIRPLAGGTASPMGEAEIAALEDRLAVRLPDVYRSFLATHGASCFSQYVDFNPAKALPSTLSSTGRGHFSLFFGASDAGEGGIYGLERNRRLYAGRMPETLLPIGEDGGGGLICLGVSGAERGKVYYWDHLDEPGTQEEYLEDFGKPMPPEIRFQNVHLVAESFADFLHRLQISPNA